MYKPELSKSEDILYYIDGTDIFNSKLLYELDSIKEVKVYENKLLKRMDLVAKDIYGSISKASKLIYLNRSTEPKEKVIYEDNI
jgi:hypothetical protein